MIEKNTLISYLINNFLNNEEVNLTNCEQMWDYLYGDDTGEALYLIGLKGRKNEIYNIASGKTNNLKYYIEKIKDVTKSKFNINYGKVKYVNNQVMYLCGDISKIRNERDWKPQIEFENGIRIMINKQTNKQTTEQTNKHPISNYGNYIRYINGICYHKIFIKKRFSYA